MRLSIPALAIAAIALASFLSIVLPAAARFTADLAAYGQAMPNLDNRLDAMESR